MTFSLDVIEPQITKKFLLENYSQETYMEYYLGIPVKKGLFRSPLRDDKSPNPSSSDRTPWHTS